MTEEEARELGEGIGVLIGMLQAKIDLLIMLVFCERARAQQQDMSELNRILVTESVILEEMEKAATPKAIERLREFGIL